MERGMRWTRRALTLAVAAPLALARDGGGADAAGGARPRPRRSARQRPGSTSRSRWPSSADDDFLVLEKASGQVKRVADGSVRASCSTSPSTRPPSAGCSASRCTRSSRRTAGSTCSGARAGPAPTPPTLDDVRLMGNRIDRFEWDDGRLEFDRNIIKFRAFQARRRPAAARQPRRRRHPLRARRQAVRDRRRHRPPRPDAEPRSTARSGPASTTTSSAARSPTTCTAPA